ncbi:MAG: hypothetical protein B0D87_04310, partial [Candidatus Sedimenticola endophacoides]
DYLQPGERLTLAIPVTVSDEHGARDTMQLTITVTGTNDVPVAEPVTELTAWEGGAVISGVVARDADLGSVLSVSVADGAQLPAGFTFESDGSYRFDPADSAYDYLRPGEQRVETVPVVITDEHGASVTSQITITIQGTNDKPVATSTAVVAREGAAVMHGQLQATDVESPTEAITFQLVGNPPAGFTLNSDGSYTFDPSDPAYDYLKAGGFRDTRLRIKATDEDGGSSELLLRLWMTGTNDAPVAGAEVLVDVDEGAVVNGKVSATDVDQRAVLTYSVAPEAVLPDGFTFGADGSYSFDAGLPAYDDLDPGDTRVFTIPVAVKDEKGASDTTQITITVTGTNDAPVVESEITREADEGGEALQGQISATDVDTGALIDYSLGEGAEAPAGFVLNPDGSYRFDPTDAAYDYLNEGESLILSIPVKATDQHGVSADSMIRITVHGTNDAPVAEAHTFTVAEGGEAFLGRLVAQDVDDDTATFFR